MTGPLQSRPEQLIERFAERHARLLRKLPEPTVPAAALDRRVLGTLHEDVIQESAARLRGAPMGDLLAAGFAPVSAPADVDWAGLAVESSASRSTWLPDSAASLEPKATPGWLWVRIRSDLRSYRLAQRHLARRVTLTRVGLAAATLAITALLVHVSVRGNPSRQIGDPEIQFIRVDRPLSAGFAPAEFARRVRDGQR